ncbi:MAG: SigE family RNA polymerase sigma factor [Actinomycetota bacterium]|nr:SigE family RNA polymerase sigma factor [Actinomycetota bacterium]
MMKIIAAARIIPIEHERRRVSESRLELLYRTHASSAVRLAYFLTGDVEAAHDIAQDAFLRIAGRFADLRNIDNFDAYLGRTVVNLTHNYFRSMKRRRAAEQEERRRGRVTARPVEAALPRDSDALWRNLQRLPRRQREAIVLRFYLDLSEHQTADLLGCAVGTVKSSVSRGLSTLRSQLSEDVR